MPAATSSDCEMIQLYEYIIVDKMACVIFDYIFYIHIVDCMLLKQRTSNILASTGTKDYKTIDPFLIFEFLTQTMYNLSNWRDEIYEYRDFSSG